MKRFCEEKNNIINKELESCDSQENVTFAKKV